MKGCLHDLLLLTLVTSCVSAPAKQSASANREHNLLVRRPYAYDPPADVASGLPDHFELAGPPPAPLFPDRTKERLPFFSPTKQTSTTTITTTTIPPPPSGLYGAPSSVTSDSEASNFNSNFVSLDFDLEVPEVVEVSPTPATLPTPKGFSPPPKTHTPAKAYMPYQIAWSVRDPSAGHQFSHTETSGGDDVKGEYRVLLPDGRTQIVTFRADPSSGYNAAVVYTKGTA